MIQILSILFAFFVPFVSQVGDGADRYRHDCGAAVAAMMIEYYSISDATPDELMDLIGYDRYTSANDLMYFMDAHGVSAEREYFKSVIDLIEWPEPVIILVDLSILTSGKMYGMHWIVVMDDYDGYVKYHDPLVGPDQYVGREVLEWAWTNTVMPLEGIVADEQALRSRDILVRRYLHNLVPDAQ